MAGTPFFALQSHQIDSSLWWLRPLLEEFDRRTGSAHPDDVLEQARKAECQVWGYYDGSFRGCLVTQIRTSRKGSKCLLWICIGFDALPLLDECLAQVEAWAKENGCDRFEIVGRQGWERVLKGFKRTAVVLEKRLT